MSTKTSTYGNVFDLYALKKHVKKFKKHGTLELKSLKCQIGGPYLNQPEKAEDDCEKIRKKTKHRKNAIVKAFDCYHRNKIASLNTANTINGFYQLKNQPDFLYSIGDLDISTESLNNRPSPEDINPLINFVHRKSKLVFEPEIEFGVKNSGEKGNNNLGSNNNVIIPSKSYFVLNNYEQRRLNSLEEETESAINSCNYLKKDEEVVYCLNDHHVVEPTNCRMTNMSNSTNNISNDKLPCIDRPGVSSNTLSTISNMNISEESSYNKEDSDSTSDCFYYFKRDLNKECNLLQKSRDELMKEYTKRVLQYKKYSQNRQELHEQQLPQTPISKTKVVYNKGITSVKNSNNNKLFIISSKKPDIDNDVNNNNSNNTNNKSSLSSSSSSSFSIHDSENSIYIDQLRHHQHHKSHSSTSTSSSSSSSISSPSTTTSKPTKHRFSSPLKIVRLDQSQIKSLSQIPDTSLNKNLVPLSMNTLIARNLPVIESKFPITRVYWMKNIASNY